MVSRRYYIIKHKSSAQSKDFAKPLRSNNLFAHCFFRQKKLFANSFCISYISLKKTINDCTHRVLALHFSRKSLSITTSLKKLYERLKTL
ncbi:hypothetical protein AB834_00885 [PVC group bacterium (ex Bugula neritina AB1)]|nr:hypothetical protein AB834_00885 [PVC group bacterium (ex Bugula neritina AB1)]